MSRYAGGVPVAEVVRSGFVEGFHHGSVVVLDTTGQPVFASGDVRSPIFPRSSNKPLQAVAMLRSGLRLDRTEDLALVAASHSGQDFHVARVRALLASGGLTEEDLGCPPDAPLADPCATPTRVTMNCSGKHAGMLLTCQAAGWSTRDYLDPTHPLGKACRDAVEDVAGEPVAAVGVDGCGAPVFAISLTALARAFLGLVDGAAGTPGRQVADAMRAHPDLVAGTGREDTRLMRAVPGLLSKIGAEGVMAVALPNVGAVALKIDDGTSRARLPVLVAGLRRLGLDDPTLDTFGDQPLLGGGRPVGAVRSLV